VFSTHLANEASKAVMNKTHKSIIRYHEQFASKAGYLHKLPQHKRLMNFNSPTSPSKDVKSTAKPSKAGGAATKNRSRQQTRNRDDVDFHEDNTHEEEEEQSSSSDNSDSDSESNSSSSPATNKNLRHFSASSEQDSHDQSRNRIDSHTSPPTSPELHNMIPPPHNRPRWEGSSSKSLFSRTEELLRAAEMAQQGELSSFDMQEKSDQDHWNKELNQSQQSQDVFSSPGSNGNQQVADRSTTFDEQPSFRSPINEPHSARRRNLSSAIDVGSPTDVAQLLSSPHQAPAVSTDTFVKPPGHLQQEEEATDDNPSTGTQPFSIQDHLGGMSSSSSQFQPTANQSQPATPHPPTLSDLSMRTANPQPQQQPQQESDLLHKQAPKHQTLHHLPPPPPTGTLPASVNQTSSTYDPRFLQQFSNQQQPQQQQHQPQQKEAEKSYPYPNPYQSYLPSLPTPQQPQQQPASSYKYPPHYPWPSHYPYFSPSGGASQSTNPLQKNQQDRQSAAVAAAAGLGSSHLGQRSDTMPGPPGHQLSHGHSGLAAGASPLMHTHATQHVSPAHLQQYMMGGPAMMSHEHYLAQAAYGYDQNSQQQALQFWQQQQQQHQKQQYPTGLPHGIHANPTQQLGAPTHPLGHASLWPTHHHLQQPSQFGKSTLFGGAQVGAAKPQDSLFRLSSNQNNNNSIQGAVPMGHVYMGYTHFPRTELFGKQDGEPESWQPPVLKSTHYQQEAPSSSRLPGMVVEDRNNRQFREEQCKKKNYNVAAPQSACDLNSASSSSNDSNSLSTSAILEQARKHSELMHGSMATTSTVADS